MANKARCIQLGNIAVGKSWDNPQSGRIYSVDGIAPTLNTCGGGQFGTKDIRNQGKEKKILQTGIKRLGNILPTSTRENPNQGRVYDTGGIAPAITSGGGYCTLHNNRDGGGNVVERIIVASRGRNPSNPSDRTTGAPTEQRLEPNSEGLCNTLTSVQKDNYVLEIRTVDDG